jgi:DNA integrity scanning protein DisA with diadenylate cyclase activity
MNKNVKQMRSTRKNSQVEETQAAPDPNIQLKELRDRMKELREDAKKAQQAHVVARSEQRMEVVTRWIGVYKTRIENAKTRISKAEVILKTLEDRKKKLEASHSVAA